jgi:hypothetical protein
MALKNIFKTRYNRYVIAGFYLPAWLLIIFIIISHIRGGPLTTKQIFIGLFVVLMIYFFLFLFRCPQCGWKTMRKTNGKDDPFIMPKECRICKFKYA